ncbi:hypothetical protein Tco_0638355 [Tanacetum coccineum]
MVISNSWLTVENEWGKRVVFINLKKDDKHMATCGLQCYFVVIHFRIISMPVIKALIWEFPDVVWLNGDAIDPVTMYTDEAEIIRLTGPLFH